MSRNGSRFKKDVKYATLVAAGCHLEGKFKCHGMSLIGGRIDGDLIADDHLIIDVDAVINGNVFGPTVEVAGRVNGRVSGKTEIILRDSAVVEGDLISPKITVEGGAVFNGMTKMTEKRSSSDKPDLKAV